MTRKYFGTDGIRGRVGEHPMTAEFAMKLGWAAGKVLGASGAREVLIGKDTRASGYMLESALESGLSAAGINVALVGPLPTPAVAYLTTTFRADAGVVISASHNPYDDNGIKFFSKDGSKLSDAEEQEIERLLEHALADGMTYEPSHLLGKARRIDDASGRYIEYCKAALPGSLSLSGLKVVVDSANGAAYKVARAVYAELGAEVVSIHDQPSGTNINDGCGATAMASLVASVKAERADLGIALDGDADRVMLVDHTGAVVDGDEILFLLAVDAKASGYTGGVVGTQMANLGLELALKQHGIPLCRAKVGDRHVMKQLRDTGWRIGGEGSGHILLLDQAATGDAIVASLQVLKVMREKGLSLHLIKQGMDKLPQSLVNVRLQRGQADRLLAAEPVQAAVTAAEESLGENGRVLLRKSGTEPLIRVMVEALEASLAEEYASRIAAVIEADALAEVSVDEA